MPDPKSLKIGDLVRFEALPEEWSKPGSRVLPESVTFMKKLIRRRSPSRISEIDECGQPWIHVRMRERRRIVHHFWHIMESTGWRRVKRRK